MPRAILAGWLVLLASTAVSFGFVVANGGLSLSVVAAPTSEPSRAAASESVAPDANATVGPTSTVEVTPEPTPTVEPSPTLEPSPAVVAQVTPRPTATAAPRPKPTPSATPRPTTASSGPSASRMALLTPCPGATGCYLYTIRPGDNLYSIANWFGVPYRTILAMNPGLQPASIVAGQRIRIPTPTR